MGLQPGRYRAHWRGGLHICLYPEIAAQACSWLERTFRQKTVKTVPIGLNATREFVAEVCTGCRLARAGPILIRVRMGLVVALDRFDLSHRQAGLHLWRWHPCRRRRPRGQRRTGFQGRRPRWCYNREFGPRSAAPPRKYGVEPLISDDYLAVEEAIEAAAPELVLGTQMERHIAKRLRLPCAVISAPVHVQDFPARTTARRWVLKAPTCCSIPGSTRW